VVLYSNKEKFVPIVVHHWGLEGCNFQLEI